MKIPQIPLYFYNTESRKKEPFTPATETVALYTCGPTVYNFAHIGNFRTYIFEDLLKRVLLFFGYAVRHVMNITDIDDKTIRGATEQGVSLQEFTDPFTQAFFEDRDSLAIVPADHYPKATEYIPQMIEFVQQLMRRGYAYQSKDKSVYFAIAKFARYGRLCQLKLDALKVCDRVAGDEYDKENVGDFVLWKAHDFKRDGSLFWQSPFGPGRPGWHLECSTMAMQLLGDTLDIHAGGVDNCFPHHENEIAQSEALTDKPFVRFWMHAEHLLVDHKKMSKSLGNFFTLRDLLGRGFSGREVRYMLMHVHYRTQLNFTIEGLQGAKKALAHLDAFMERLQGLMTNIASAITTLDQMLSQALRKFSSALADDLNISEALAVVFDLMHEVNTLYDQGKLSPADAHDVCEVMGQFNRILGLNRVEKSQDIAHDALILLEQRNRARKAKNFKEADRLRDEIGALGYLIEDTPYGAKLKAKN